MKKKADISRKAVIFFDLQKLDENSGKNELFS
jgi:hypothetical protein